MPRPIAPPPSDEAGALTNPRQLQRWLDVNPVPVLTRIRSYFELPIFSVDSQWKGYSEIVAVFNYTAANNFTLKPFTIPTSPNYVACIMWIDADYNVYRYRLWEDAGEVFFFDVPLYTNQKIGKNFRIEIWNVEPETYTQFSLLGCDEAAINITYTQNSQTLWAGPPNCFVIAMLFNITYTTHIYRNLTPLTPIGQWTLIIGAGVAPYGVVNTTCSQASALTLYTSKLGNYDYRYANDYIIATTPAAVTNLSVALPANLTISWPANSYPTINS